MAGDPASLAAVQAAVSKSVASQAGDPAAPKTAGSVFDGAIAQDLAVMAEQAKSYSAGAAAGNVEAENQRSMQSGRLQMEAAQAAAARARALEAERMQTQRMALEQEAARQANRLKLEALDRQKAETAARQASEPKPEDTRELERVEEVKRQLLFDAVTKVSPTFGEEFNALLGSGATNYGEFRRLVDAYAAEFPTIAANKDAALRYGKAFFDTAAGKRLDLGKALAPPRGSFLSRAIQEAARTGGTPRATTAEGALGGR